MPEELNYGSISGELHHLMRRLSHKLHFSLDNHRNKNRILHIAQELGGITQSELTEKIGITPASMSTALTKLEREGLIYRESGEKDKRTHRIYVTEKGANKWKQEQGEMNAASDQLYACLTEEEKRELCRILRKLDESWDRNPPEKNDKPHGGRKGPAYHDDHHGKGSMPRRKGKEE